MVMGDSDRLREVESCVRCNAAWMVRTLCGVYADSSWFALVMAASAVHPAVMLRLAEP